MAESTATAPAPTGDSVSSGSGRSIAAAICVVLAILLTTPSAVAYWGQRTLTDSQRYLNTVEPLVNSPEVQAAIATKVSDAIIQQVDVEAVLTEVFAGVITERPRLEQLIGPISGAVNGQIESQVRSFVASETFADLWVEVNTRAQQNFVRLLEGDNSGAISLQGEQVVLDLSVVIDRVKERLVARGLTFIEKAPIPDIDKQIVLLEAPGLKQARTIYAFANPISKWLIVVVALLYLGAFLLSRRRARMTVIIGVGLAANALLVAFALSVGRQLFVNELSGTVFGPASSVFYDTLLAYLQRGWQVLLGIAAVFIAAGWFSGPNASGTAVRTSLAGALESGGAAVPAGRADQVGRWVAGNARWLRGVVGALGVLVLLWGNDVSLGRLFWSVVLVVGLLAVIQFLIGAGRNEPAPSIEDAPTEAAAAR